MFAVDTVTIEHEEEFYNRCYISDPNKCINGSIITNYCSELETPPKNVCILVKLLMMKKHAHTPMSVQYNCFFYYLGIVI